MNTILEASGLGKRYGRRWALRDCTLQLPAGHVVGLVGANGAGKSTLIHLAVGLLTPTAGTVNVAGRSPAAGQAELARVGFVAQEAPIYGSLTVDDHLKLGAHLNGRWDEAFARRRVATLGLDLKQKAGRLSGGQRAQLALALAIGKRPELLLLDEPIASLDPLARREFLRSLMEVVAEQGTSVILSSHLMSDLERVCDHVVVLGASRVQVAGGVDHLLATHHWLTGPRRDSDALPSNQHVIQSSHTDRQSTFLVQSEEPIYNPAWTVQPPTLEDLVLAYMGQAVDRSRVEPALAAVQR